MPDINDRPPEWAHIDEMGYWRTTYEHPMSAIATLRYDHDYAKNCDDPTLAHNRVREEFYLLVMLAYGDFGLPMRLYTGYDMATRAARDAAAEHFDVFRQRVHPDYYINGEIPMLTLHSYLSWLSHKRQEKQP